MCAIPKRTGRLALIWVVLTFGGSAGATHAGFITEAPASVGTLFVTRAASPDPVRNLMLGGAILADGYERRYGGSYSESALKFDLGSIPRGSQVTSATFRFTVAVAVTVLNAPTLNVDTFPATGPPTAVADFSALTTKLGSTGSIANLAADLPFTFDVTSLVGSLAGGISPDIGFLLSVPSDSNVLIYGDDAANPAEFRPSLSITYGATVPGPSSLILCGVAGVIGLAVARARPGRAIP